MRRREGASRTAGPRHRHRSGWTTRGAHLLRREGLVDELVVADARNALDTSERVAAIVPELCELVVNCVNVPGTELASILCARDGGTVYFFSMSHVVYRRGAGRRRRRARRYDDHR